MSKKSNEIEAEIKDLKEKVFYTTWHSSIYAAVCDILKDIKTKDEICKTIKAFCEQIKKNDYLDPLATEIKAVEKAYKNAYYENIEYEFKWVKDYISNPNHDDSDYENEDEDEDYEVIRGIQLKYKSKRLNDHRNTGVAYFDKFDIDDDISRMEHLCQKQKEEQYKLLKLYDEKSKELRKYRSTSWSDSSIREYKEMNCHQAEKQIRKDLEYAADLKLYCGTIMNTKILSAIIKVCHEDGIPLTLRIDGEVDQPVDSLGYYYSM